MQQQFRALGRAIWVQPLFLNMNGQTVIRSDVDRIEGRLTRCPFHRFFHIEVPQSPVALEHAWGECAFPVESPKLNRASS